MPQQSNVHTAHTWSKICGITTTVDAQVAIAAGADAVGFNCYPQSKRYVAPLQIADICNVVGATRVALFVDPTGDEVRAVLEHCDIDLLQFQGEEGAEFCGGFGLPYMKALRMRPGVDVWACANEYQMAWALLLDTYVADQPGGTGERFDLSLWPNLASWPEHQDTRLVLAGGLTPDNVGAAIDTLHPFGVDVAGGVEGAQKGHKDQHKVERFIQEVRRVGRQ